jgi:hypothetical protein
MTLYKVSVNASKTGWSATVIEYEARESKKSYIISVERGDKRISFDKIGKYDTMCYDSTSHANSRMFITNKEDIAKTIDGAVESIRSVLQKMLDDVNQTISHAPEGKINPEKIQIEKYDENCGLKGITITDDML